MRLLVALFICLIPVIVFCQEMEEDIIVEIYDYGCDKRHSIASYLFDSQGMLESVRILNLIANRIEWQLTVDKTSNMIRLINHVIAPGYVNFPEQESLVFGDQEYIIFSDQNSEPDAWIEQINLGSFTYSVNDTTTPLHQLFIIENDQVSNHNVRAGYTIGFHINEPQGIFEVYDESGRTQSWGFTPEGFEFVPVPNEFNQLRITIKISDDYTPPTDPFIKAVNWYIAYFISQPYMLPFLTGQFR